MAAIPGTANEECLRLLESLEAPAQIFQQWNQGSNYRALQSQVHGFLRDAVPIIFKSPEVFTEEGTEGHIYSRLLSALEWFIFCDEPSEAIEGLKQHDTPSSFCGRVFKVGEPNYSCRDCALDPTCVLCIDCFQHSGHKKHRYKVNHSGEGGYCDCGDPTAWSSDVACDKHQTITQRDEQMNTSGGGGYCDCGDVEAWKSDPACEKHQAISQQDDQEDPLKDFPEDVIRRASYLFQILINYCNKMFSVENQEVLPEEIRPEQNTSADDSYCTMLFNDEVHTYDQVIDALKRATSCNPKGALELATIVDKEGRTSVRNSNFRDCESAKSVIINHTSRNLKPLKVLVMHSSVVAHQDFALKLMEWLIQISSQLDGLRHLVCEKLMTKAEGTDDIIVECCLFRDSKLWKAARTQWHELLMSTMLLDNKYKKELAILLTKHYKRIQYDYAHDDHDHSLSVTAITVQVYTVPTMGLMLVREHSLIKVIIRSFLDSTKESRNLTGKYEFKRFSDLHPLRRIMISLTDLRYVLSNKPPEWDQQLRNMVMEGLEAFLELMKAMHGMDSVVRVVGHHIEYDPEWEMGIHLHVHLKMCITLFLEWCTADKKMLINAYRATLKMYRQTFQNMNEINVTFAGHTTTCFRYEVSHRQVSVHYALSRFLAGLHVGMGQFNLSYLTEGLLPQQPIQPIEMIEEPLRVQVLVAELHAGQWRRNGYSLVNQVYFYKNVKCREEMYDRDIQMLQVGASLMEPDDFILCMLNRFELIRFLEVSGGETGHAEMQEILGPKVEVMEEFLQLLIVILCERYLVGVGEVEPNAGLRREVLHQLCITSLAHSELEKNLPENYLHETGVEEVVTSLANYKKPTKVTEKGKYELKKECLKEYSPYFYHFSRSEQSKSEEQHRQRLDREGIKDSGAMYIPQLPPQFCQNFKSVVKLLDCKMFISILKVIFHRAIVSKGRLWSENLFQKSLYLVALALMEEERSLDSPSTLRFTDRASRGPKSLLKLLQGMVGNPKVVSCVELLDWIFKKFDGIQTKKGTFPADRESVIQQVGPKLIDDAKEEEKEKKAELARQRREHLMAQMSAMQKKFIEGNSELFEEMEVAGRDRAGSITSMDVVEGDGQHEHLSLQAIGPNKSPSVFSEPHTVTCILCQEEERLSYSGKAMVYSTFVQRSSVLSNSRDKYQPTSVLENYDPLFSSWDIPAGCHARTCGHVMHATCWQSFFDALVHRERRRVSRFRGELNYDISKSQFLCPLCETLSNTVLPILPPLSAGEASSESIPSMDEWLLSLRSTFMVQRTLDLSPKKPSSGATSHVTSPSSDRKRAHSEGSAPGESVSAESDKDGDSVDPPKPVPALPMLLCPSSEWEGHLPTGFSNLIEFRRPCSGAVISPTVQDMLKTFSQAAYTVGLRVMPDSDNERIPILSWNVCAYTIQSTEINLRVKDKPLFGALPARQCDTLRSLVRHAIVCSWLSKAADIQKYVLRLLAVFDKNDTTQLGPSQSILDIDVFTMMVSLLSSYPALYQKEDWTVGSVLGLPGSTLNLYLLRLCFTIHLVQILLSADMQDNSDSMDEDTEVSRRDNHLTDLYCQLHQQAYGTPPPSVPTPWMIQQRLCKASVPFLRWSVLYFHFLTSVPHPIELEQASPVNEFELLCNYLALPTDVSEMFDFSFNPAMKELIQGVCNKPALKATASTPRHFPLKVNKLIELPEDYMDIMNDRSLYVCPKAGATQSEGRAPAMCLICGTVVCSHSYCCQVEIDGETLGACSAHAMKCNEGTGIFLRVRDCVLLLMASKNNSCPYIPPYVDEYGEPDQGLRRGNPLHLSPERYRELHKMWIAHEIPAEVTRRLESNNNLLNIQNI